jgi:hypothetical protein
VGAGPHPGAFGGNKAISLLQFKPVCGFRIFRGGTKCPTPIGRLQLRELQAIAAVREALAPAAGLGEGGKAKRAAWRVEAGQGEAAAAGGRSSTCSAMAAEGR